jgi:hypothetical protein
MQVLRWKDSHAKSPHSVCWHRTALQKQLLHSKGRHALQPPQPEVRVPPHTAALAAVVGWLPEACQRLLRVAAAAGAAVSRPCDFDAALLKDPARSKTQHNVQDIREQCRENTSNQPAGEFDAALLNLSCKQRGKQCNGNQRCEQRSNIE